MSGSNIKIIMLNNTQASIKCNDSKIHYKDGDIEKVDLGENKQIARFSPIRFRGGKHIIKPRYISKIGSNSFKASQDNRNISTQFILPLLFNNSLGIINSFNRLINLYSFLDEVSTEEVENDIHNTDIFYLVYRFSGSVEFIEFEFNLLDNIYCKGAIDLDTQHTAYLIDIKNHPHKEDINLIKKGKYSKISKVAKEKVLNFFLSVGFVKPNSKLEDSIIYNILERTEFRRKQLERVLGVVLPDDSELYEFFNPIKETYFTKLMAITDEERNIINSSAETSKTGI